MLNVVNKINISHPLISGSNSHICMLFLLYLNSEVILSQKVHFENLINWHMFAGQHFADVSTAWTCAARQWRRHDSNHLPPRVKAFSVLSKCLCSLVSWPWSLLSRPLFTMNHIVLAHLCAGLPMYSNNF